MAEGKAGKVHFLMPDFRRSPAEKGASCIPQGRSHGFTKSGMDLGRSGMTCRDRGRPAVN
ncbi:hypothetical protein FY152_17070 [Agrobacterium tumefaciens]|nr:hypothetical protein FY152_17070 [Agrobacterium tumefaciens]